MSKRKRLKVLRTTPGGLSILDGADVFRFIDTYGLPLEEVFQRGVFDFPSFIKAAAKSGNWRREKLEAVVREAWLLSGVISLDGTEFWSKFTAAADAVYGPKP